MSAPESGASAMNDRRLTLLLLALTAGAIVLAAPAALREALARGELYVFTSRLLSDIPLRLAGPGRFRFILQPLVAILLGLRDGRADARTDRGCYLLALFTGRAERRTALLGALTSIANVALMAIFLDLVSQWMILGIAYPGAALVVGPVLISAPYVLARTISCRARLALPRS